MHIINLCVLVLYHMDDDTLRALNSEIDNCTVHFLHVQLQGSSDGLWQIGQHQFLQGLLELDPFVSAYRNHIGSYS